VSRPPSEPERPDPFSLLGVEARFEVDPAAVRAAFRERAAVMHPDRAIDPAARLTLARAAAELAEAQRVLLDPVRRGEALLGILGGSGAAPPPSGEFLVEMLEIREGIEEAADDPSRLDAIRDDLEDRFAMACDRLAMTLSELAERGAADRAGGHRIAAEILGRMRYLQRLRRAIDDASAEGGGAT